MRRHAVPCHAMPAADATPSMPFFAHSHVPPPTCGSWPARAWPVPPPAAACTPRHAAAVPHLGPLRAPRGTPPPLRPAALHRTHGGVHGNGLGDHGRFACRNEHLQPALLSCRLRRQRQLDDGPRHGPEPLGMADAQKQQALPCSASGTHSAPTARPATPTGRSCSGMGSRAGTHSVSSIDSFSVCSMCSTAILQPA